MSSQGNLRQRLAADVAALGLPPGPEQPAVVSETQLAGLPSAAQRYLRFMEVPGKPADWSFLAHITGRFRLRPGLPWLRCAAWQYSTCPAVTRLFHMRLSAATSAASRWRRFPVILMWPISFGSGLPTGRGPLIPANAARCPSGRGFRRGVPGPFAPGAVEAKREQGAQPYRFAGRGQQAEWDIFVSNDRETPVVESDQLRQDLCAQAAAVAGDRVDPQPGTGDGHGCPRSGTGSTPRRRLPQHRPCACRSISASNTRSVLRIRRTAPSGW